MFATMSRYQPAILSILRIVVALLFLEDGLMKLFHFPAAQPGVPYPLPPLLMAAAVIEVIGGLLLLVGLFTRPIAFLASGEMAVAYFLVHARQGFWPALNGGEPAILYSFVFLYLCAAGGGSISIDALRSR